ncbi:MAG: arginine--tRNA ligase, partial [Candidatus Aenigmarchaeota archaeon]|nr:arginine--tRNA ligase [Candidatus Aenigmarchaeota archaeon]
MFEDEVLKLLKSVGVNAETLEIPPQQELGDYSFPCFELAKQQKKNPNIIANEIAGKIKLKSSIIEKVEVKGAYVNFFLDYSRVSKIVLNDVLKKGRDYGKGKRKEKFLVEFAHPNTHKLFHIGHLRNITTGESVARILEFSGAKVVRANYQGDVGLHIAKC